MPRKQGAKPETAEPDLFAGLEAPLPARAIPAPGPKLRARAERPKLTLSQIMAKLPPAAELAEVAVEGVVRGSFTYLVDERTRGQLAPGARVLVPFGPRAVPGYYLGPRKPEDLLADNLDPGRLKAVLKRIDAGMGDAAPGGSLREPLLTPELQELARWIARQYACALGTVLAAMLPAGVKRGAEAGRPRVVTAAKDGADLQAAAETLAKKAPKQAAFLHALAAAGGTGLAADLLAAAEAPGSVLKPLEKAGLLTVREQAAVSIAEAYGGAEAQAAEAVRLTEAQAHALEAIESALAAGVHRAFLLQGVTGSGKTEVYLRALQRTLALGRQGIVLVPEIALTPQTAQRFEQRLGRERVAVLHSHLTAGERAEAWRAVRAGRIDVVVGARSALFAPLARPGCIIVDEEHEGAFKQDTNPRYHAREVAEARARLGQAVLVLGSATPSLESYQAARSGRLTRLLLPERVAGAQLPPVSVVDMREENRDTKRYNYLSRGLRKALHETIERREQAILFLNRRGFATVITCLHCGHTEKCERCDITLTSHRSRETISCHYCGFEKPVPKVCSECKAPGVKFWGQGTERVEEEVRAAFPEARIARMDSDTMTRREAYLETLGSFRAGKLDVLVGTQMIAKGLDFPNVTLVGIVLADTALHMPDFRSRERTFQLLEQVAGRAGRGTKGGRVIVQTYLPHDVSVKEAADHDYEGFCLNELRERQSFYYPPFARLGRVLVRGKDKEKALAAAREASALLRAEARLLEGQRIEVLGPSPAPIAMLDGQHRFHLLVKAPDGEAVARLFGGAVAELLPKLKGAETLVDVDPLAML